MRIVKIRPQKKSACSPHNILKLYLYTLVCALAFPVKMSAGVAPGESQGISSANNAAQFGFKAQRSPKKSDIIPGLC